MWERRVSLDPAVESPQPKQVFMTASAKEPFRVFVRCLSMAFSNILRKLLLVIATLLFNYLDVFQVTFFPHPQPSLLGVRKELIKYKRESDGLELSGMYVAAATL